MSIRLVLTALVLNAISVLACGPQDDPDNPGINGPVPWPQVLNPIHAGATLSFRHPEGFSVEVGSSKDTDALEPDDWGHKDKLPLPKTPGSIVVFARMKDTSGDYSGTFSWIYEISEGYQPPAGQQGSNAVCLNDERIKSWATKVENVQFGKDMDEQWKNEAMALGPAQGTSTDILCLGRGGSVVLKFDPPIVDGPGDDFAVFENGINDTFLELATVDVSSDGKTFVPFAHAYLGTSRIDAFGAMDTTEVGGFAGKYRQGFGTPFDLSLLQQAPEVIARQLDLHSVTYIRIKDVVGDGQQADSFDNPIYDPYPTTGSAGFDLDGVAVLNQGS